MPKTIKEFTARKRGIKPTIVLEDTIHRKRDADKAQKVLNKILDYKERPTVSSITTIIQIVEVD